MLSDEMDIINDNLSKIQTYAELMCNVSPDTLTFDGKVIVRIGAEFIISINKIKEVLNKTM